MRGYEQSHKRRIVLTVMTSKLAPIILAVFALSIAATAQTWTFQGTQICYNLGSTVQCYARGTINSFVSQRDRAFESGRQAGQGVGSLAGVLIAAWLNHRQQVKIETEELTKELQAYFDAEFGLIQDEQKNESADQQAVMELEQLDPVRRVGCLAILQSIEASPIGQSRHPKPEAMPSISGVPECAPRLVQLNTKFFPTRPAGLLVP